MIHPPTSRQVARAVPRSVLLLVLACLAAPVWAQAEANPDAPPTLTIVAYNVENFFDVFDDPYSYDEQTQVKPRDEIEQIAAVLRLVDADVIVLSEIENTGVAEALRNDFLRDLGYREAFVQKGNGERGIHLGVISRLPVLAVTSHRFRDLTLPNDERTWRYARDLLEVRFAVTPQRTLSVFIAHFKSKRDSAGDPQSRSWRLAEARMARQLIDQRLADDPDAWVVLAGDLNDTPDSPTLEALLGDDDAGDHAAAPPRLHDVHDHLPPDRRITYLRAPYRSAIDYILASPALARRRLADATRVIDNPSLLGGADHAPVVATFRLDER